MTTQVSYDGGGDQVDNRIAIVGMAARVPGAQNIAQLWQNLVQGTESLTLLTDEQLREEGIAEERIADPHYVRLVPLMEDMEGFDAKLFGYHPREAEIADPQQRIFLEVCHSALQHAGYDPAQCPGRVGVFGGAGPNRYDENVRYNRRIRNAVGDMAIEINNGSDYVATRVAYALGLDGPAVSVMTACSTSLVAIHLAGRALMSDECAMAVAGGVNVQLPYYAGQQWAESSLYSPDGHIRAFDASAGGTNFGNGAGAVVLKRYRDAVADGDHIHAVILGSAVNNDGARRMGFSAPGADGQVGVILQAFAAARDVAPDTISYVEAHGTGTLVGDPIEVSALSKAFRQAGATGSEVCPIGSIKTNIGHLAQAAGVAGLIKTVLAFRHDQIPASLHYREPNPRINFAETPFYVNDRLAPWPRRETPRRAGVSSFGIGGTNAHLIVEEPPEPEPGDPGRPWHILPISARTSTALATMQAELAEHLRAHPEQSSADVAYTLQVGRPALEHRAVAVGRDHEELIASLARSKPAAVRTRASVPVAFLFPGQGAQYVDMAAEVYRTEATFREILDECCELARPHLGGDLRDVMFSRDGGGAGVADLSDRLRQTRFTQPAMFAIEYALARLWMSWGVEPDAMVGHSVGEYVAACLADVFTLAGAVEIVATRGRLTQSMPAGSMLALPLSEDDLASIITDGISLAAVNAPRMSVVAGPTGEIRALQDRLGASGVRGQLLETSHAFHSAMLDPVVGELRETVARIGPKAPGRRFVSTLTGSWITPAEAVDPGYWADQLRSPVRFAQACQTLGETSAVPVEVGPGQTLTSLAKRCLPKGTLTVTSLGRPGGGRSEARALADAAGKLWSSGVDIDWSALHRGTRRRRVPLPVYPYERRRYWVKEDPVPTVEQAAARTRPAYLPALEATFLPTWRQERLGQVPETAIESGPWLVFSPGEGPVEAIAGELEARGASVVRVGTGAGFTDLGDGSFLVDPASRADYDELLGTLAAGPGRPAKVLHGWTATPAAGEPYQPTTVATAREDGFYSLLFLSQALMELWPDQPADIRVITSNCCNVSGTDRIEPGKALVAGPCLVVPTEAPQVAFQMIDISRPAPDAATTEVGELLDELAAPIADRLVAYRHRRRWVADYEQVSLPERVKLPRRLRRRGVYLITGGMGGIGATVAAELARTLGARLVLVGRSPLPERDTWDGYLAAHAAEDPIAARIRTVREIESLGGEVFTGAADVCDEPAMRKVLEAAREHFGRIDGVFHAAGLPGGGLAVMRSREQADAVLAPKIDGTLVLDRLLGAEIDLMVLFSSIISVSGYYGMVDYCAANAFLDSFAQSRAGHRPYTIAINYCGWTDIGMVVNTRDDASEGFRTAEDVRYDDLRYGEVRHPLLGRRALDTDDIVFSAIIDPKFHWVLTDHQIGGEAVFPGTSYVELIHAAYREAVGPGPVELRDLLFSRPVAITQPRELRVIGQRVGSDTYQFTVISRVLGNPDASWEQHAQGSATAYTGGGEPPRHHLASIRQRCDLMTYHPDLTDPGSLVQFGPRWQVVESVQIGRQEQLVELALPAGLDSDLPDFVLHPSLLDGATALGLFVPDAVRGGRSYLPMAYDRLVVREPLPARAYSHIRSSGPGGGGDIMTFDIAILDESGREVVSVENFAVRQVDGAAIRSGMDATSGGARERESAAGSGATDAPPVTQSSTGEVLITPAQGIDLLWRILDGPRENQYVVSVEYLDDRMRRIAKMAQRLATAGGGQLAGPARRDPDAAVSTVAVAGDSSTEQQLLALWRDTFGINELAPDEDFFELGGNSLVAVQLAVRIRETFGVNVPGVAVLEYPTARALARRIDDALAEAAGS